MGKQYEVKNPHNVKPHRDEQMLMLAARAARMDVKAEYSWMPGARPYIRDNARMAVWNPLEDDGDAFRLAVYMGFLKENREQLDIALAAMFATDTLPADPDEAARRMVTLAAATVAKGELKHG